MIDFNNTPKSSVDFPLYDIWPQNLDALSRIMYQKKYLQGYTYRIDELNILREGKKIMVFVKICLNWDCEINAKYCKEKWKE